MASPLLLSVNDATIAYGDKVIFEGLSFNIHQGSKISLVGNNGAGKTTLMDIITGKRELDAGERWEEFGMTIGYLRQDIIPKEGQTVFDYIFEEIQEDEAVLHAYKVDTVAEALHLDVKDMMTTLSGGQIRRAGLARILVEEPDILLLDEPTNHLDLEAIEWLENYLKGYRGTILCISHDRTFLSNVTNKVFWLDRGSLKICPRGFGDFEEWSTMLLEQEERELKNRKSIVAQEVEWASRGVKARRKRNVRRVELVKVMREKLKMDQAAYRRVVSKISLPEPKDAEASSKIVAEFYNVQKSFTDEHGEEKKILDQFNMRITRGDRIGLLGKNGSGKTTFLKMLIGDLEPDMGRVKRRKELEFSYFDQKRSDLDPEKTLHKTLCPGGGDYVDVMGKERHVCAYLKDFLFDPGESYQLVSTLSGGQKNRLMLAKILANPKSCLILDEPTNDLDMDTLDMLEEVLINYKGTLIVVSHDRDFLDQTVTKILAFEGNAEVEGYVGGYSDYLAAKNEGRIKSNPTEDHKGNKSKPNKNAAPAAEDNKPAPKKLSYNLHRELQQLPDKIEKFQAEINEMNEKLGDSGFYQRDPDDFHELSQRLVRVTERLKQAEERWLELEEMREGLSA